MFHVIWIFEFLCYLHLVKNMHRSYCTLTEIKNIIVIIIFSDNYFQTLTGEIMGCLIISEKFFCAIGVI